MHFSAVSGRKNLIIKLPHKGLSTNRTKYVRIKEDIKCQLVWLAVNAA
jgi:hypothetical protein